MNGEKPKFKPWKEVVEDLEEAIKITEQNKIMLSAQLDVAKTHLK